MVVLGVSPFFVFEKYPNIYREEDVASFKEYSNREVSQTTRGGGGDVLVFEAAGRPFPKREG